MGGHSLPAATECRPRFVLGGDGSPTRHGFAEGALRNAMHGLWVSYGDATCSGTERPETVTCSSQDGRGPGVGIPPNTQTPIIPPAPPRRRGGSWLVVGIVVGGLVVCCGLPGSIGAFAVRSALLPKEEVGWVDDQRRTLPEFTRDVPEPNAFDAYQEAVALYEAARTEEGDQTLESFRGAWRRDDVEGAKASRAAAEAYLSAQRPALDKLREGLEREYMSDSELSPQALYPWAARYRQFARMLATEAALLESQGRPDEALERCAETLRFGAAVPRGGSLIERLVGIAVVAIGADMAVDLILDGGASRRALLEHARAAREAREALPPFSETLHAEAECMRASCVTVERDGVRGLIALGYPPDDPLSPAPVSDLPLADGLTREAAKRSREWMEDRYAALMEEADKPASESRYREISDRTEADATARNDILGRIIMPVVTKSYDKDLQCRAVLWGVETVACLEAYKLDHGAYPESLDALAPEYMPEIALDPWTDAPMAYRLTADGYTLYAVGPDRTDDGGVTAKRTAPEPDLVFAPRPPLSESAGGPEVEDGEPETGIAPPESPEESRESPEPAAEAPAAPPNETPWSD